MSFVGMVASLAAGTARANAQVTEKSTVTLRQPFGITLSQISSWAREMYLHAIPCFDPRDTSQRLDDPLTWTPTINPALIRASLALVLVPLETIDWKGVARIADRCEAPA
jgi:hypothetical protein